MNATYRSLTVHAGRADARYFNFVGFEWVRLLGGWLLYLGVGGVFVVYVAGWRERP
jgi:hypothetical protein